MKCLRQPAFLNDKPTPITEIWEVRLPLSLWQKIQRIATVRRKTFSTITRFCVFQLAERAALRWHKQMVELHQQDSREIRESEIHRHMVCLYGEDAKLLRLAALELGISVSAFIRLALRIYLRYLAMDLRSGRAVSDALLFWKAIKRWFKIPTSATNHLSLPARRSYFYQSFPPEYRWKYP
jgi:hypothetical protein